MSVLRDDVLAFNSCLHTQGVKNIKESYLCFAWRNREIIHHCLLWGTFLEQYDYAMIIIPLSSSCMSFVFIMSQLCLLFSFNVFHGCVHALLFWWKINMGSNFGGRGLVKKNNNRKLPPTVCRNRYSLCNCKTQFARKAFFG